MPGPHIDLKAKARLDALEGTGGAAAMGYTVADTNKWPGADPTTVKGALDTLASRTTALEAKTAATLDYAVADTDHWPGADPTKIAGALDALASRVTAIEAAPLVLGVAVGAEVGDAIPVTVTCTDGGGDPVDDAIVLIEIFTSKLAPATQHSVDATTGTALSETVALSNNAILVQADAGVIAFTVTDKLTTFVGDVFVRLIPIDRTGAPKLEPLTFA